MASQKTAQEFLEKAGNVSMEYLTKFKSKMATTVVDTVYNVENITKNVVPGNPVTREYEVTRHVGSCGPQLLWKIYSGFKKSTKQEAAIFVLHKKSLEHFPKKEREAIIDTFKKGTVQLARLKHPRILSLQHQLEESKDSLAFATEPCFCSVANAMGNHENMPSPLPIDFVDYKLYDVEIKYGLMQIAEALSFLHKDAKLMHRSVCPESIIINQNGAWKLACFELSLANCNDPNDPLRYPFKEWDQSLPVPLNPILDYLAPEYALSTKCDCSSDMFSYGMLFYSVYNNGKPFYKCDGSFTTFTKNCEELKNIRNNQLGAVPTDVREYLKLLMHINPDLRPDANQVVKIPFFDDVAVKTLEYLDSSFQVDNLQKSMFFKSLPQIIDKLPKRVCLQRIIPCLEQEFINADMIPFVLPNIFLISEIAEFEEFNRFILPKLKPVFKLQKPVQILLITLRHMNLLLSKTAPTDVKEHILPMVCKSLESELVDVQELCLSTLPSFASSLDTQSIKQLLIPRIRKLCLESQTLSVRVNGLVCLGKLLDHLEKWIVLDDVLPILEKITVRDSSVLMAILGIYKIALTNPKLGITKDILATRILPLLIPISIDNSLNMQQFSAYFALIRDMLNQIETEHKKKLEQIDAMEREKSIIPHAFANAASNRIANQPVQNTMMDQLMIGYGVSTTSEQQQPQQSIQSIPNIPLAPKKPMTLQEKQEAARKQDQEVQQQQPSANKSDLFDLNFNSGSSLTNRNRETANTNSLDTLMIEYPTSQSSAFNNAPYQANAQMRPTMNNMMQQSTYQQQSAAIRPTVMSSSRPMRVQDQRQPNNNMGFFGNLALPAPQTQKPPQTGFPDLLKPTTTVQASNVKKSALDDWAEFLG